MPKHTPRRPATDHLPFHEWAKMRYPQPSKSKQLLRMIGALDVLYLLYRAGLIEHKEEPSHEIAPIRRAIRKTAAIPTKSTEETPAKKRAKRAARKTSTKKKTEELTLEFDTADQPKSTPEKKKKPAVTAAKPKAVVAEVQQKETDDAKESEESGLLWPGDEALEDTDLRKTDLPIGIEGITVAFDVRTIEDERETVLSIDDVSYRVSLMHPPMNLGRMLQIARVTYGELFLLGRAALGALSGEGYVPADEAQRVVRELKEAGATTTDVDVLYFSKDAETRNRTSATIRVRFEPL